MTASIVLKLADLIFGFMSAVLGLRAILVYSLAGYVISELIRFINFSTANYYKRRTNEND